MNKRVEFQDLLKYRFLSSPRFSPDGSKIAFAVHRGDLEDNRYISNIWVYDLSNGSGKPAQLTSSGFERAFCWSVDGTKILFVSERPSLKKEGQKKVGQEGEGQEEKKKTAATLLLTPIYQQMQFSYIREVG